MTKLICTIRTLHALNTRIFYDGKYYTQISDNNTEFTFSDLESYLLAVSNAGADIRAY